MSKTISSMNQSMEKHKLFRVFRIPNPAISRMLMLLVLSCVSAELNTKVSLIDDMMNWIKFLNTNLTKVSLVFRAAKGLREHLKIVEEYNQI